MKKLLTLLLILALLVGCTGNGGNNENTDGTVLNVATDTDLSSMDHHVATDGTSFIAQSLILSGLTELDENNMPVAELAETWDISADGLVYTFHLADAEWSNGTPVTAADFVFGWQRLADPASAAEYQFIISTINLKNADAVIAGELPVSELGVKAIDDKTLEVTLDAPCDFLLGLMAFPTFFPLNEAFYNEQGDQYALSPANLLSCGPYIMTSWTAGNSFSFTKNENYFRADEFEDAVDVINYKFIQDTQSAMLEYQSSKLDVVKLSGEMVDAYANEEGFTNRLQGYLWYLSLNFTTEKIQNDDLREALALAIDRETIATAVLKDGSVAADGIVPIALSTGPDGKDYRETAGTLTSYDPTAAAAAYEKAKAALGGDVTLELLFEDTEASKAVAEYIQHCWETNLPGITVNLNSKPKKTRLELMTNQEFEVALTRWGPDYADPQTYLDLFVSTNADMNSGRYNSAEYDATELNATTGEASKNSQERWNLLVQAEKILLDDNGVIPVYQNGGAMMIRPTVKGIEFHSAGVDSYRHVTKN